MRTRVYKFFKNYDINKTLGKNDINSMVDRLFLHQNVLTENQHIYVNHFFKYFHLDNNFIFENMASNWRKYVPFMYKLQAFFVEKKEKSFKIFPIFSHGRKHLLYTSDALRDLLLSMEANLLKEMRDNKEKEKNKQNIEIQRDKYLKRPTIFLDQFAKQYWLDLFNIQKFNNEGKRKYFAMSTDGINVSLHMIKVLAKKTERNC